MFGNSDNFDQLIVSLECSNIYRILRNLEIVFFQQFLFKNNPKYVNQSGLTHCMVDSSTVICWMSPFAILWVSGLFSP